MPDTPAEPSTASSAAATESLLARARRRGVLRVAVSYCVIGGGLLQVADLVLERFNAPNWTMVALIVAIVLGLPVALLLAWFYEIGDDGIRRDTAPADAPRPTVHGIRRYFDLAVIAVLLVVIAVLWTQQSGFDAPPPPENPAIAVLPFENLSGDPEQEYFSDGLAEEMLDRLGRVPGLKVIARSSSFGFKGRDVDVRTVAERLGVTTVLEGSVRRDGKRLRLSARLVDGASGQQVWSGSFDREQNDIFAVQAELAAAVVEAIVPAARGEVADAEPPPTSDLDAYDLYLLARSQLAIRTPESIEKSVELSQQAVTLDPDFARSQAQLGAALLFQRLFLGEPQELDAIEVQQAGALLRRAEQAIHKALALDPDLSEAHGIYANLLRDTGRPGAEEQYRRALELNPNSAVTWHDYAVFLGNIAQKQDESHQATKRALELDPRQPVTWANYLNHLGDPRDPLFRQEYERALRMVGDMPFAIDRFTMPVLSTPGFPVEVMKAGLIKRRNPAAANLPPWINEVRAWREVDLERARRAVPSQTPPRSNNVDMEAIRLFIEADLLALDGDWPAVERNFAQIGARVGPGDRWYARLQSVRAFWYSVRGRYEEAAQSLARAEPIPESWLPPVVGGDAAFGLMETAQVRIYRATGREEDAQHLVTDLLGRLRSARSTVGDACNWGRAGIENSWVRLASLAANEGFRDEAVDALRHAMRCGELPAAFRPQLPWFSALEGYPPYDELLQERARRIEKVRAELLALEAGAGAAALPNE